MFPPIEPPPSRWRFPDPETADEDGIVGLGADLEPGTLLLAYRSGLFPMKLAIEGPLAWWSPDPRAVLPLNELRVTRSLAKSVRRYTTTVDRAFRQVMTACASPDRPHGWITEEFIDAYETLHELGWAHSIETWHHDELVGGLYGVSIGGFFAGESMFHRTRDASKVALVRLVEILGAVEGVLLDVQWQTDHLASLGAIEIPRREYLELVGPACELRSPFG